MQYLYIYKNKIGLYQMQVIENNEIITSYVGSNRIINYLKNIIDKQTNLVKYSNGNEVLILDEAIICLDDILFKEKNPSFLNSYRNLVHTNLVFEKTHSFGQLEALKIKIELNKTRRKYYEQLSLNNFDKLKKIGILSLASSIVIAGCIIYNINKNTGEVSIEPYDSSNDYGYEEVVDYLEVTEPNVTEPEVLEPEVTEVEVTEPKEEVVEEINYTSVIDLEDVVLSDSVNDLVIDFIDSEYGIILKELCDIFGIEYQLMIALGLQESGLNHNDYALGYLLGLATGMFQIEFASNNSLFCTNIYGETIEITPTEENLGSFEGNAQIAIFMLKSYLEDYNNNLVLALDSYNKGQGTVDIILAKLAEELNCTVESLIQDLPYELYQSNIELLCSSPVAFVNSLSTNIKNSYPITTNYFTNWGNKSYGTASYTESVIWYYNGVIATLEANNYNKINF